MIHLEKIKYNNEILVDHLNTDIDKVYVDNIIQFNMIDSAGTIYLSTYQYHVLIIDFNLFICLVSHEEDYRKSFYRKSIILWESDEALSGRILSLILR